MKRTRNRARRGAVLVEMALTLMPLFLGVVATMEMARCLWTYHTLSSVTKQAARYSIVHGAHCAEASATCGATVADVAQLMLQRGIGLDGQNVQVTLSSGAATQTTCTLTACLGNSAKWPASPYNVAGLSVTVSTSYEFPSILGPLWPGQSVGALRFSTKSTEVIQF